MVEEPVLTNPLTGEATQTDYTGLRPYCVMINNIVYAIQPRGVSKADIVFEEMDEGGITRTQVFFMDISQVPEVGSIRSARIYNVYTAMAFDAFMVHCGGSPEAQNYLHGYGIEDIDQYTGNYLSGTFYRDSSRGTYGSEHTLFAYGEDLAKNPEGLGYRLTHEEGYDNTYGLTFSADAANQCTESAKEIYVTYSGGKTTSFSYDEQTKAYTAYQYGGEYMDDSGDSVPFKNVLVLYADTWLQSDGSHLSIDLSGGTGYFATEGKYVPINWYRESEDDNFHFTLEDGTPLKLNIGKTFVAVNQQGSYNGYTEFE